MGIQRLEVEGFRSFKKASWKPGSLNLVVGPNGAGKSNLLRLLEFISSAARGKVAESVRRAGGIIPLIWNHAAKELSWKVTVDPLSAGKDKQRDALTYEM